MTFGQYRVGVDFNTDNNTRVTSIKMIAAELIDYLEEASEDLSEAHEMDLEVLRLFHEAQTRIEDAAMWAVKAVTKRPREC